VQDLLASTRTVEKQHGWEVMSGNKKKRGNLASQSAMDPTASNGREPFMRTTRRKKSKFKTVTAQQASPTGTSRKRGNMNPEKKKRDQTQMRRGNNIPPRIFLNYQNTDENTREALKKRHSGASNISNPGHGKPFRHHETEERQSSPAQTRNASPWQ